MEERHAPFADQPKTAHYEIRIRGHLDQRWADWLEGMHLRQESDGCTTLCGAIVDQAALHGLLKRVRDMGLELVSVMQIEPNPEPDCGRSQKEADT